MLLTISRYNFLESTVDNTEKGPGPKPEEKTACPCMLAASQTQDRLARDAVGSSMSTGSQSSLPSFSGRAGMESSMAQGDGGTALGTGWQPLP